MSYFVFFSPFEVATPTPPASEFSRSADADFSVVEADEMPFGRFVAGGSAQRRAYLLTTRGDSTDVLGRGSAKQSVSADALAGFRRLLETTGGFSVAIHFFSGALEQEVVTSDRKSNISWDDFSRRFPKLEEDVRYTVT